MPSNITKWTNENSDDIFDIYLTDLQVQDDEERALFEFTWTIKGTTDTTISF